MSRKRVDGVEAILRKADAALDDWFRQSRISSQEASAAFARFLDRTTRQGAGALRHQVDGLQASLKKLSTGLEQMEHKPRAGAARKTRRATGASKAASVRKPSRTVRKSRKAA
jgi:hypothetical protein